jgi:transcriptional regulator with XRE-family HTH domain
VPKVTGPSLGDAVHALLQVAPPKRTWKSQLRYVTSKNTGASRDSVARQLGIHPDTITRWANGKRAPSKASQAELTRVFDRFWEINNRHGSGPNPGRADLTVRGKITVDGRERKYVILEPGRKARQWKRLRTASAADISAKNGELFISALDILIPYIQFHPSPYTIETK